MIDDGRHQTVDLHEKWSTTILKELMSIVGGDSWKAHVAEAKRTGMPLLEGEEVHEKAVTAANDVDKERLPNLTEYLKANPDKAQKKKTERKAKKDRRQDAEIELGCEGAKDTTEQGSVSIPS